jgi:hypothetical protein
VSQRTERLLLASIVAAFVALAAIYSIVVPPFEASDELWHYPMVKVLADTWTLPVQDPANVGPWRQEGSQPPLYYFLAALATAWVDTSDMPEVRHLNPHVDNGVATLDGNINLVVHDPTREAFPWRGTVLAVHLVRLLSVLMAAAGVTLTWLVAREVCPGRPWLALGAAALHAFTPMVVFIAGAVNNDNLVIPLSSLALWMLLRLARPGGSEANTRAGGTPAWRAHLRLQGVPIGRYLLLGSVLGLAALTKTSSLALALLTALVVTVRAVRRRSWAEFVAGGSATLVPMLAIAGWWYVRNLHLYGDITGLNAFIAILGQRDVPADLAQLWRERFSFAAGYWGNFGGLNVPMPAWVYTALNSCALVAVVGLLAWPIRLALERRLRRTCPSLAEGLMVLWGLGVLIPWAQWASVTWSSQGRLVFAALPVWCLGLMLGLAGWLPRRWGHLPGLALAAFLLGLSAAAPWAWIRPAYALPRALADEEVAAIPVQAVADFGGVLRLLGYRLEANAVQPGDQVEITLYWEALAPAERDYTVFVHLLGEGERLLAQRDTFPGLGRLSTMRLVPGMRWADRTVLRLPPTAYAPDTAQIEMGLFDATNGRRLPVAVPAGQPAANPSVLGDVVRFGQLTVESRPGVVPNPQRVNFGGQMALVGYDLSRLMARPGDEIQLTLYWQALGRIGENYTISAQLVDAGQRKAAQHDGWPQDGAAPTATWQPQQVVREVRRLAIFPDAPPGVYDVRVAIYTLEDGQIVHLPVIPVDGTMLATHVVLTRVRITE